MLWTAIKIVYVFSVIVFILGCSFVIYSSTKDIKRFLEMGVQQNENQIDFITDIEDKELNEFNEEEINNKIESATVPWGKVLLIILIGFVPVVNSVLDIILIFNLERHIETVTQLVLFDLLVPDREENDSNY